MIEAEKQGVIYSVGFIVAILIGFFVWQSELYDRWEGLFAFGIVIFALVIINSLIFGKKLYISAVLWIGIISLLTTAFGSFYTFDLILTIFIIIIIACVVASISLYAKG